jgi:2-polyprenyl-3-methyl-5-hydroxy-6-metoxy-1,4-benzoquinol methylase
MTDLAPKHERPQYDLYSDFSVEKYQHLIDRFARNPAIRTALQTAKIIADFGSRLGNTAIALANACPYAIEIHTIDYDQPLDKQTATQLSARISLIQHRQTITEFLEEHMRGGLPIDIFTIAAVPDHMLDRHNGYSNLSEIIVPGGVVFEFGDTNLNPEAMESVGFSLAAGERKSEHNWLAYRAWQKS